MELILINKNKLKIMLDENDMKKYHIGSEADCAEGDTRRAIRTLLESAKDQIGFDTDGEEIFVQLYASKRGGCELFVTKCDTSKVIDAVRPQSLLPAADRKKTRLAYSFGSLKHLLKVCKILHSADHLCDSEAYSDSEGRFYLILASSLASAYIRLDSLTFITEFGKRENPDMLQTYLSERGQAICDKNAVETLGSL